MKKRNTIIIVVVLLLGICAFFIVRHGSRKSTSDEIFHIEDVSAITKIYMADKLDNKVLLERTSDSTWTVDGKYPASEGMRDMLLDPPKGEQGGKEKHS